MYPMLGKHAAQLGAVEAATPCAQAAAGCTPSLACWREAELRAVENAEELWLLHPTVHPLD